MLGREYDCIVIGAGPAGLFCAAHLAPARVLVLEKMVLPGRKLLIAGSGQCNITHAGEVNSFTDHYGDHGAFLRPALMAFPNTSVRNFFEERGVSFVEKESSKVFPASLSADDILDALLDACDEAGTEILSYTPAEMVSFNNGMYAVKTLHGTYYAKVLVLATGGKSYPQTGSTGDGFMFAETLGHSIAEPHPSLAPVYVSDHRLADLSGISIPGARISVWRDGRKLFARFGDLLITRFGYSGPVILDAARWMRAGDQIRIAFSPKKAEELDVLIRTACTASGTKQVKNLLDDVGCPDRLIKQMVKESGIPEGTTGSQLTAVQRSRLVRNLTAYQVDIDHVGDFRVAMVTAGGVVLNEINKKTCESKIAPGLFCVGEVLDIDGDTGGYNIQACFSTAFLAAQRIRQIL
ncbi:MAG: NAD(P)/FAD-dependent oxidoreductase [Methanocalculaceae archaeon]|jgi:predicted Rossmann fold flavoprotein|nr:NAD(P)/FAD-dependent oxidoreductase [Methanocalculaceae archaeon]